jgi:hypothetical protein
MLFTACSEPQEASGSAADAVRRADQTEAVVSGGLEMVSAPDATVAEASEGGSVNYLPVLLRRIEGADQIAALQQQVREVQTTQRRRAELTAQISAASDSAERSELEAALARVDAAFAEQNEGLKQAYGIDFASPNEYLFVAQKSEVLVQADPESTSGEVASEGGDFVVTKVLEGAELIRQFSTDYNQMKQVRAQILGWQQALTQARADEARAELEAKINQATEVYQQNNRAMFEAYGFTFARPSKTRNTELNIYVQPPLPKLNEQAGVPDDYIFIGSLDGAEVNLKFRQNLQIAEASRAQAQRLSASLAAATDDSEKADLQSQLDSLRKKIDQDAKTMLEAYKFSKDRNYRQVVTKARLYIQLTEEEIATQKEKDPNYVVPEDGYAQVATINNADANLEFQKNIKVIEGMRQQIVEAKQALQGLGDEAKKSRIQALIDAATEKLSRANTAMAESYRYSLSRNYQYVIEASDLYLQLTRAEMSQL